MPQNTSSAVMQQRRDKAHKSLDDFPTPPWGTRGEIEHVLRPLLAGRHYADLKNRVVVDPCCNRGHMVRPLTEYFGRVYHSDIADYGSDPLRAVLPDGAPFQPGGRADFLLPSWEKAFPRAAAADWFFLNPPYKLGERFIAKALDLAREGVAVFVRCAFGEGIERYEKIFRDTPPTAIAYFAQRIMLFENRLRDPDIKYWDPKAHKGRGGWVRPSSATAYVWMTWLKDTPRLPTLWIPPRRKALTRPGDYPVNPDQKGVFVPPAAAGQEALL